MTKQKMAITKVPCCYYPCKIVIVDDRPDFTKWMALKFQNYGLCEVYNNSLEAFDFFKNYHPESFMKRMAIKGEFDFLMNPEHKNIAVDLEKIQKEAQFPNHHGEVSVAIIDYDMPRMNGLELCRAISHLPFKKIMLTGEADHKLAVEAFNQGLIDRFILKNTANVIENLDQAMMELQLSYFYDLSKAISENPQEDVESQIVCLTDPDFAAYFYGIFHEKQIKEFYLLNHFGDFLLRTRSGKSYKLGVRDQKAVAGLHHLAQDLYNQDPEDNQAVLEEILACKKLPFFPKGFDEYNSLSTWPPYMHPVQEIKAARNTYACALFAV